VRTIYSYMGQNLDADRELLARAAAGDNEALKSLYRSHRAVAHGVALRVLRDAELAEDAIQEGFLDLWRTAPGFDAERSSVRGWLCVLVHRRAVDLARREARRHAADDDQRPAPDRASYTAEEIAIVRYDQRRVRSALRRLPQRQRELIEHAYWGGLTQPQLAERFGLPLGTVKSRTFEALRLLREELVAA